MTWWFAVVEAKHELQNPTSAEKIRLLGQRLGLEPGSHVLDVAAGKGGPAVLLAREFGCRITCVERAPEFTAVARERIAAMGLAHLVEVVEGDARAFPLEPGHYDAALCLGASFVWGGLEGTLEALAPAVKPRGFVAVGEPYWRASPLPSGFDPDESEASYATLAETIGRMESAGVSVVGTIAASEDDWDAYESLHWQALDEWLEANPDSLRAGEFRALGRSSRERYITWTRSLLGWAILIGRT
jgi:SAM-dependent methyltransferase